MGALGNFISFLNAYVFIQQPHFYFQIPPPWVPGDEVQDEADFRHFQDFIENDLDIGFEAFECLPDEVPPPCEFNHL